AARVPRPRRVFISEARAKLHDGLLELLPTGDDLALPGDARRQPGALRPRGEVGVRLDGIEPLGGALDPRLPAQVVPVEAERRARISLQLGPLAALVPRRERAAPPAGLPPQPHAHGGT